MSTYYEAWIDSRGNVCFGRKISKKEAMARIRKDSVYAQTRRMAHTLAEAVSQGAGSWKDGAHVVGGYRHYHDVSHRFRGHIFFGGPHGEE